MVSQALKKGTKHRAHLPRTATLRHIKDMANDLRSTGVDPSRIEERAQYLLRLKADNKRKRPADEEEGEEDAEGDAEENAAEMDVDGEGDGEVAEADWMDVDGEEDGAPKKRLKTESGAVAARGKRAPRSDRRLAGMRDNAVSIGLFGFKAEC